MGRGSGLCARHKHPWVTREGQSLIKSEFFRGLFIVHGNEHKASVWGIEEQCNFYATTSFTQSSFQHKLIGILKTLQNVNRFITCVGYFWNRHLDKRADSLSLGFFPSWPSDVPPDKKKNHKVFYVRRRLCGIMMVVNIHNVLHKHTISRRQQCNHTHRCNSGQPVDQGFNLANEHVCLFRGLYHSSSQSLDTLISRLLVYAAGLALIERKMKERRERQTECLVPSPLAEEILLEQGCGNAKAGSQGLSRVSLAGCRQRGLWEITRD